MKIELLKFKQDLKSLALKIRQLKSIRKQCENGYVPDLYYLCSEFRDKHIAYCLARGRTYKQIEPKSYTLPRLYLVQEHFKKITGFDMVISKGWESTLFQPVVEQL